MDNEKILKREKLRRMLFSFAPAAGLVILFALFMAFAIVQDINIPYSLKNILNQSVIVIVVATGAISGLVVIDEDIDREFVNFRFARSHWLGG